MGFAITSAIHGCQQKNRENLRPLIRARIRSGSTLHVVFSLVKLSVSRYFLVVPRKRNHKKERKDSYENSQLSNRRGGIGGYFYSLLGIGLGFRLRLPNVFDANADLYVVCQQDVRKYSEWQSPPATYWGPSANDVQGLLTLRFDFPAPTASILLKAETLAAYHNGGGHYGSASLWGSKDGSSWQLLQDNPTPA